MTEPIPSTTKARKPRKRLSRTQQQRRGILRAGIVGAGLLLLQPFSFLPVVRTWRSRLRPPGALKEDEFLSACIKCGQCVQVCPVQAIELADLEDGMGMGVPFVAPRKQACDFSCDALSCILACPTGALSHTLEKKEQVRMGLARLARPDACLARQGKPFRGLARGDQYRGRLRYEKIDRWNPVPVRDHPYDREICDLCVLQCPIGETALRLTPLDEPNGDGRMTPVVGRDCVGCGACEMICPSEPPCIVIDERKQWSEA